VQRVVKLYETWGKPDKAAEWRAKLPKPGEKEVEIQEQKNHHIDTKDTKKKLPD
jgi:hypothetical protein